MKHILIILSILSLSSPLFGDKHKGEILYKWKTSSGEVWMGFGDKDTHPNYNGQVENGEPSGLGVIYYPNGNMYIGEWKDGKRNGQGTLTLADGGKYVGEFWNGKVWTGTRTDKNGKIIGKFYLGSESYEGSHINKRGEREWN